MGQRNRIADRTQQGMMNDGLFRPGAAGAADPMRGGRGRGYGNEGGGRRGDEPGPRPGRGIRPGGPGQHPQHHFPALPVRVRLRNGTGHLQPPEYFQYRPEQIHFDIADWAIAGNRIPDVAESLWFYNPFGPQCRSRFPSEVGYWQTRIGDHCFYNPTDAYYRT